MEIQNLDIVYILGTGSHWNNNEIRYSLRSICQNLKARNVYIIGHKPNWLRNVFYIPAEDPYKEKLKNACYKLKIACKNKDISDNFILMNDDFFIMKKVKQLKPYFKGVLSSIKNKHPTQAGYYHKAIEDTIDFLAERGIHKAKDYSLHYPFIFNKQKLLNVIEEIENDDRQLLLRTIYGNINNIGGEFRKDVKLREVKDLYDPFFLNSDVISTTDAIVRKKDFFTMIHSKFSRFCKFEIRII